LVPVSHVLSSPQNQIYTFPDAEHPTVIAADASPINARAA
jgi:hypothetical protein